MCHLSTFKSALKHFQVYYYRDTVNGHAPAHHEGWMVSGQETIFCWVPVPYLTSVVHSVAFFFPLYLPRIQCMVRWWVLVHCSPYSRTFTVLATSFQIFNYFSLVWTLCIMHRCVISTIFGPPPPAPAVLYIFPITVKHRFHVGSKGLFKKILFQNLKWTHNCVAIVANIWSYYNVLDTSPPSNS